ncbi:MAG: glycosyltransferase, partial [Synergistaceae bacterium]|nr:glycosyltransferase [Synergistaceae bacterium]
MSIPVTVLTVSFNAEATIARTIESVMAQTYDKIEYIVIDGASKDNTAKIAESFIEKFNASPDRSMRVISEPDKGMYDALNKGARLAKGVIIGQINADDWYEPDA